MNQNMFCGELELGYFLGSILEILIPYAFGAVSESTSSTYDLHTNPSGIQVLNFRSLDYETRFLNEGFDLVSSENHKVVDFISTKKNPKFLINKAAVELFEHLHNNLEELGNKVIDKKLVVTGQSLGGCLAILFTLWLHDVIDVKRKSGSKVLSHGVCDFDEFNSNALRAGITLQFKEVGVLDKISNDLIEKLMEGKCEKMKKKSLDTYSVEKKLIKRKIKVAYMEWFISFTRSRVGYYECFKSGPTKEENSGYQENIKSQVILNQYWENFVKEKELTPQNGVRKRLPYSANNYRRMFEPVEIAKYYKKGNINYIENRPNHYKVIEEWWNEDKKGLNPSVRKNKGPNVNGDSCFWVHVEEAWISLRILMSGNSSTNVEENEQKLDDFMAYVMHSVKDYALSSDVFLKGSSLMIWWSKYNTYKQGSFRSEFAQYMKSGGYKSYR